jgi:hypothetical protein
VRLDLVIQLRLPHQTTMTVAMNNVFDKDPPLARTDLNDDALTGDPLGRTMKVGVQTKSWLRRFVAAPTPSSWRASSRTLIVAGGNTWSQIGLSRRPSGYANRVRLLAQLMGRRSPVVARRPTA